MRMLDKHNPRQKGTQQQPMKKSIQNRNPQIRYKRWCFLGLGLTYFGRLESFVYESFVSHFCESFGFHLLSEYYIYKLGFFRWCCHQTMGNVSGTKLSKASSSFSPSGVMWSKLREVPTAPKVRHFMWKVVRNWVACKANLFRRKCASSPLCPICNKEEETIEHILFRCD